MTCEYFYHKIGNGIAIVVGEGYELGKFWFSKEGESETPLTEAEAETLARRFVEYLNKEHPITKEMAEKLGDSEEAKSKMDDIQKLAECRESGEMDDDAREMMAKLMLASLLAGGCK